MRDRKLFPKDSEEEAKQRQQAYNEYSYHILGEPGVASAAMSTDVVYPNFVPSKLRRGIHDVFTNKSFLSSWFWQSDGSTIVGTSLPKIGMLGRGGLVSAVLKTGDDTPGNPIEYSLSASKSWS